MGTATAYGNLTSSKSLKASLAVFSSGQKQLIWVLLVAAVPMPVALQVTRQVAFSCNPTLEEAE